MNRPDQKKLIEDFLNYSKRILRFGTAFVAKYPEKARAMKKEIEKIRALNREKPQTLEEHVQIRKIVREAYIAYIVKLARFGFQYLICNREAFNDVAELKRVFKDYDLLQSGGKNPRRCTPLIDCERNAWVDPEKYPYWDSEEDVLTDKKREEIEMKIDEMMHQFNAQKSLCEESSFDYADISHGMKKMRQRLDSRIDEWNMARQRRIQREKKHENRSKAFDYLKIDEALNEINEQLDKSLRKMGNKRQERITKSKNNCWLGTAKVHQKRTFDRHRLTAESLTDSDDASEPN